MNLITTTQKDMSKYEIVQQVLNGGITNKQAADKLRLSKRQVQRLKAKIKTKGIQGVAHGNRGRASNRKINADKGKRIVSAVKEKYHDFGPTLAHEKLVEIEKIPCTKSTVRNLMILHDLWIPKKARKPTPRLMRLRRAVYGEMMQYDGSYHYWLENSGEELCLLLAVDDTV